VAAYGLTPRESDIAGRLLRGLPVKTIASDCRISQHTVRGHCKAIFDKAGVSSRGELMANVYQMTSHPGNVHQTQAVDLLEQGSRVTELARGIER
jgi:DNA-binding CsgD family transcriptional regulator